MAAHDNTYSRVVAWLKVLLPVIALALLSTMFLISRSIDPTQAITYSGVDVEDLARDQRISGPSFSGVTEDGAAISFHADTARPEGGNMNRVSADQLTARIETPDGALVDIVARTALIDGDKQEVTLSDGVTLATSTDYLIEAEGLTAALDSTRVVTDGPITATGPMGRIVAGEASVIKHDGDATTYLLVFKHGVKLVYTPKGQGSQ
ncbi:hypothetical protein [Aliiroseovarius subalbicans]|uniref:hypothetical protein n=1 Tax=Aliiroseovarius subalbicans TaxID=2925840 RepID=UPI001F55C942|nr:hypothetical protein [Aliiroseovarius subalbicans]MCI2400120.1 hypothetical protein [Aliiroseovarius subalbicans]